MATKKAKDLSPKKNPKGGRPGYTGNDNYTLVRSAKPAKKDLSPKKSPKGGKKGIN